MKRFGLPKLERLRRRKEIDRVFAEGKGCADGLIAVRAVPNGLEFSRIVACVGTKLGNSAERNRVRRTIKEVFRLSKEELPKGLDVVVMPRKRGMGVGAEEARKSLQKLLWKAQNEFFAEQAADSNCDGL